MSAGTKAAQERPGEAPNLGDTTPWMDERRLAQALRESERKYRELVEHANSIILRWTRDGRIIFLNEFGQRFFGYSEAEIRGRHVMGAIVPETESGGRDLRPLIDDICRNPAAFEQNVNENMRRNGERVWVAWTNRVVLDQQGQVAEILSIGADMTERKRAEARVLRLNHLYAALSRLNRTIVQATDRDTLFRETCRIVVEHGQFRMAWIGLIDQATPRVNPVAFAGDEQGYLSSVSIAYRDEELGRGPTGTAIREGHCVLCQDIATDPIMGSWRAPALQRGYRSSAAVPIRQSNQVIGALTAYAGEPQWLDAEEEGLLVEIGQVISYALDGLVRETQRRLAEANLQQLNLKLGQRVLQRTAELTERKQMEEALRESEAQFRQIFERSAIGKSMSRVDGKLNRVNQALADMLGYTIEELQKVDFAQITHPDDVAESQASVRRLLAGECTTYRMEKRYRHRDGHWVFADVSATLLRDACNVPLYFLASIIDITPRKRAEAERQRLEEQLGMAQRMEAIGSLAGGIAHDFNNLLSVILGYTDFAMDGIREGDSQREALREVKKAAERAVALTRQLLAFSRKQMLQPVPLNLNHIAAGVEKMLRRILGEDIDYVQVLSSDLGVVCADPGQIEQVLMNLVVNARDAMPDGGKLTIETGNVELDEEYASRHVALKPGSYVQLAVSDTGCGMDAATRARVFEPFFTTKEKGKGTGLGLSTVYGIVKQSGGSIWVYSEPGQGTTFKIYLPRVLSAVTFSTPVPAVVSRPVGTETVLLVEDEEAVRELAQRVLRSAGYTVLAAASGADALAICGAHQGHIHMVLTDVVMPQMGGKALVERLAAFRPGIKILYMSGYTDDAIVHHGTLDPGTHFIGKPFNAADLAKKVRAVLDTGIAADRQGVAAALDKGDLDRESLRGLPEDLLGKLLKAVIAARYDDIVEIIETLRATNPNEATVLLRMAQAFDYVLLRRVLGQ